MKENEEEYTGCTSGSCAHCHGCESAEEEFEPTITLVDDDGKEVEFEILDVVILEDEKQYLVVTEVGKESDEPEAVILEIKEEDGEEVYDSVTDEAIAQKVFDTYISQFEETDGEDDDV